MRFSLNESVMLSYDTNDWDSFTYEVEDYDAVDKLMSVHTIEEMEELLKSKLPSDYYSDTYDKEDTIRNVLVDNLNMFHEELESLFEDEAREEYDDSRRYEKDPYRYNGLDRSDFD